MGGNDTFQHRIEYQGFHLAEKLVDSLPDHSLPSVARFLAFLAYYIIRIRRRVSLENLKLAFPDKSVKWRNRIAYFSYLHFSLMILEFMKMQKWSQEHLEERVSRANIEKPIRLVKSGRGAIIVSGHYGNWELAVNYYFVRGIRSAVIQQRQKNDLVDRRMKEWRERWGLQIIYPRGAVQNCEKALKAGEMIALLGDQDAGKRGVFVPFFNRPASTHIGAAILHMKTGAPLFTGLSTRVDAFRFDIDMLPVKDRPKLEFSRENLQILTTDLMRLLEKSIRKHPEQYFWMHRRWKTAPPAQ